MLNSRLLYVRFPLESVLFAIRARLDLDMQFAIIITVCTQKTGSHEPNRDEDEDTNFSVVGVGHEVVILLLNSPHGPFAF